MLPQQASLRSRVPASAGALGSLCLALLVAWTVATPAVAGAPAASRSLKVGHATVRLSAGPHDIAIVEGLPDPGGAPRWRAEVPMGGGGFTFSDDEVQMLDAQRLLVGRGPVSVIDVAAGKVLWTLPGDRTGTLDLGTLSLLPGDRFVALGTKKAGATDLELAKNPRLALFDLAAGKLTWARDVDPHERDIKYGSFWQRFHAIQTTGSAVKQRTFETHMEGVRRDGATSRLATAAETNQLLVIGDHIMGIGLEDGGVLWEVKNKGGVLRGLYGHLAYMRYGDDLRVYDVGSGEMRWSLDLTGKGATLLSRDDLLDREMTPPEDMDYLLVSEGKVVSRVDPETGKVRWTVPREDRGVFATRPALVIYGRQATTAYDWAKGETLWTFNVGRYAHPFGGGDVTLFVDRGKESNGQFKGPFAVWAVRAADGKIVWSKDALDGRKISGWKLGDDDVVTLVSENGTKARIVVATGSDVGER